MRKIKNVLLKYIFGKNVEDDIKAIENSPLTSHKVVGRKLTVDISEVTNSENYRKYMHDNNVITCGTQKDCYVEKRK